MSIQRFFLQQREDLAKYTESQKQLTLFLSSRNFLVLLLFNSRTRLKQQRQNRSFTTITTTTTTTTRATINVLTESTCDPPLPLRLVFDALVLAYGFAVFHWHLGLVGTHLFALPAIARHVTRCTLLSGTWWQQALTHPGTHQALCTHMWVFFLKSIFFYLRWHTNRFLGSLKNKLWKTFCVQRLSVHNITWIVLV